MAVTTNGLTRPVMPAKANGRTASSAEPKGVARLLRPSSLQAVLLLIGAILLPTGLIVIGVGWYGAAHTPNGWEQTSYLISGGLFGLGLVFVGGFLYFGAWLAKIAMDNREAMARLSESFQSMADAFPLAHVTGPAAAPAGQLVATAHGNMAHRPDCALVAGRTDLHPVRGDEPGLKPCGVCLGV